MTTTPLWIQLIGLALALSGWAKVAYDLLTASPKVRGRILNIMRGQMQDPRQPSASLTAFTSYLYLVNERKNVVHLLDYELEVKVDKQWSRLERVYGLHTVENLAFNAPDGEPVTISSFSDNLIYRKNQPVEFGKPLHGWIMFAGTASLHQADIACYRLTCIDAFDKRHVFQRAPKDFGNLNLLQEIAGISLPKSARSG